MTTSNRIIIFTVMCIFPVAKHVPSELQNIIEVMWNYRFVAFSFIMSFYRIQYHQGGIGLCFIFVTFFINKKKWFIIQRQRNSSASSARSTQPAKSRRPLAEKSVTAHSAVVATIANNWVSRAVLNQFSGDPRRHQRRSHSGSHASPARRQQLTA